MAKWFSKGFIWTMWDVKKYGADGVFGSETEFYMNYVGCKVAKQNPANYTQSDCFIWTMWDVKCKKGGKLYISHI